MKVEPFAAEVRFQDGIAIMDLNGEIDAFAEQRLHQAYDAVEHQDARTILLNFTMVHYINSTGIALIVGILARARKDHRSIVTYGLSDHYIEIFKITRLADFMAILPDEAAAVALAESAG